MLSTRVLENSLTKVEYYLPEYARLPFSLTAKWEKGEGRPRNDFQDAVVTPTDLELQPDNQGQMAIVVFDPYLMAFSESPTSARKSPLKHGGEIEYFVLTEEQAFHYGKHSFGTR